MRLERLEQRRLLAVDTVEPIWKLEHEPSEPENDSSYLLSRSALDAALENTAPRPVVGSC